MRAVPDAIPAFGLIDPFAWSMDALPLPFPFFVKPVKGTLSVRAGLVQDAEALQAILKFTPLDSVALPFGDAQVRPLGIRAICAICGTVGTVCPLRHLRHLRP